MRKTGIVEILKFLKYMGQLNLKRIFWAFKTRYYCKRFHNQWWQNSMIHGAGKYVYTGHECQVCGTYHYEFKINK